MRTFHWLAAVTAAALLAAACRTPEQPPVPDAPAPQPVGTLREIMHGIVEYNAFTIFNSVVVTVTAEGTTEKQPTTDDEWDAILHAALALSEAPNLLVDVGEGGRPIASPAEMNNSAGTGELAPIQIQTRIADNREQWLKYLSDLQNVGKEAIDIVNRKDVEGLYDIGEKIDRVCESCHVEFWYPDAP